MTRRRRLARPGAAAGAVLVVVLTGCSGSDTPADDISPQDTLQSDNTVGTDPDETDGPTDDADDEDD